MASHLGNDPFPLRGKVRMGVGYARPIPTPTLPLKGREQLFLKAGVWRLASDD
jgi:hypothetical protein